MEIDKLNDTHTDTHTHTHTHTGARSPEEQPNSDRQINMHTPRYLYLLDIP